MTYKHPNFEEYIERVKKLVGPDRAEATRRRILELCRPVWSPFDVLKLPIDWGTPLPTGRCRCVTEPELTDDEKAARIGGAKATFFWSDDVVPQETPMSKYNLETILHEAKIAVERERDRPGSGVGISTSRYDKSTQGTMRVPAQLLVDLIEDQSGAARGEGELFLLRRENEQLRGELERRQGWVSKEVADNFKAQRDALQKERDAAVRTAKQLADKLEAGYHQTVTTGGIAAGKRLASTAVEVAHRLRRIASQCDDKWKALPDHLRDLAKQLDPAGDRMVQVLQVERSTVPVHTLDGKTYQMPIRTAKVDLENKSLLPGYAASLKEHYGEDYGCWQELQGKFIGGLVAPHDPCSLAAGDTATNAHQCPYSERTCTSASCTPACEHNPLTE
jgi:hypothetical protein